MEEARRGRVASAGGEDEVERAKKAGEKRGKVVYKSEG